MNEDIWGSADEAVVPPSTYFGRVDFDMYYCVLQKGEKTPPVFDPQQHREQDRRTNITVTITPLSSAPRQFITERRLIAESREWAGIVLPSIKALGLSTRELNNRWVRYEMVPTGRKYTKDGIEKESTTFKFLQVYTDEADAERAAAEFYGGGGGANEPEPANEALAATNNAERETALRFLPGIVAMAGGDEAKLATMLAQQPLLAKYFTVRSPEVQALLNAELEMATPF